MNITTEPVRDKKIINDILIYLKGQSERNYLLAKVQLNTALRISDVIKLKVSDFSYENRRFKECITLIEKKTDKERRIAINQALNDSVKSYININHLDFEDYLFRSRKGINIPISTTQAHRIFQDVAKALKIESFGTHSLRKSWGYFAYKETNNIALIMQVYNHSSERETLKYIGITQQDKNVLYNKIKF